MGVCGRIVCWACGPGQCFRSCGLPRASVAPIRCAQGISIAPRGRPEHELCARGSAGGQGSAATLGRNWGGCAMAGGLARADATAVGRSPPCASLERDAASLQMRAHRPAGHRLRGRTIESNCSPVAGGLLRTVDVASCNWGCHSSERRACWWGAVAAAGRIGSCLVGGAR